MYVKFHLICTIFNLIAFGDPLKIYNRSKLYWTDGEQNKNNRTNRNYIKLKLHTILFHFYSIYIIIIVGMLYAILLIISLNYYT